MDTTPQIAAQVAPAVAPTTPAAPAKEGFFSKLTKWIVSFVAKLMWQPDPFTGKPNEIVQSTQAAKNGMQYLLWQ